MPFNLLRFHAPPYLTVSDRDTMTDRVLEVTTIQANVLKNLFDVLKDIIYDGNLQFDVDGLKFSAVDGHKTAFVNMHLPDTWFDEYYCEHKTLVGVSLKNLHALLKTANTHDIITMYVDKKNTEALMICIKSGEKIDNLFELYMITEDQEDGKIFDIEFDCIVTLPSAYFQKLCKDMKALSDDITIKSRGSNLFIMCSGQFASQCTKINSVANDSGIAVTHIKQTSEDEEFCDTYSASYLVSFNKASILCTTVELYMKRGYPLIMKYNVGSEGELKFCLCAKVDLDETDGEDTGSENGT